MSEPTGEHREPATVYVVTDLDKADDRAEAPDPYAVLAQMLRPLFGLAVVVVPMLSTTALLIGLLLGWPPFALLVAAVLALPVLVNLVDLVGARAGWPPLSWTASRIAEGRRPESTQETPPHA